MMGAGMKQNIKIKNEAMRIEEDCTYSSKSQFEAELIWDRIHILLGIPIAILSAISGASALSDYKEIAASLAFLVATLIAVSTFLGAQKRAENHRNYGNKYLSLRNRARLFWQIKIDQHIKEEEIFSSLEELNHERDELNKLAPQVLKIAFLRARKGIESGEAKYKVDNKGARMGSE